MLRESYRQRDGLAAILPDSIVDLSLAAQYGALTPGRCLGILVHTLKTQVPNTAQASIPQPVQPQRQQITPAPATPTVQNPLQWALQITAQTANECKAKRLRGELPNYVASAQCSNVTMLAAFNEVHYRYMDLIQAFAAERVELASKIDRGEMTGQQAQLEGQRLYASLQATERQRDRMRR